MADYILRDDAIQCAVDIADDFYGEGLDCSSNGARVVAEWLKDIPAADVRPVVIAHWEVFTDSSGRDDIRCSSCKQTPHWTVTDIEAAPLYCPNCGAEMRAANDRPYEGRGTDSSTGSE